MQRRRSLIFTGPFCLMLLSAMFFDFRTAHAIQEARIQATITISVCGNNIREADEECDGSAREGKTCVSFGFSAGTPTCTSACTFSAQTCSNGGSTSAGGGGGSSAPLAPTTGEARFSGIASFSRRVTLLQDGQIAARAQADKNGLFVVSLAHLAPGSYTFSFAQEDDFGGRSPLLNVPVTITAGTVTNVQGIALPTIVLTENIPSMPGGSSSLAADVNGDGRVNLVDFSIAAFWYGRTEAPPPAIDLSKDGKIDLVDFSIMAFEWTG